jgi:hypothetical protein
MKSWIQKKLRGNQIFIEKPFVSEKKMQKFG